LEYVYTKTEHFLPGEIFLLHLFRAYQTPTSLATELVPGVLAPAALALFFFSVAKHVLPHMFCNRKWAFECHRHERPCTEKIENYEICIIVREIGKRREPGGPLYGQ
jgi:hypothetical protein